MKVLEVCFYKASAGTWFDKLIAWVSKGKYSHVELVFDNNQSFSSSVRWPSGVRFKSIDYDEAKWDIFTLVVSDESYDKALAFANSQTGKGYDILGVLFIIDRGIRENKNKWFCSEVVLSALQAAGYLDHINAHRTTPQDLFDDLTEYFADEKAKSKDTK